MVFTPDSNFPHYDELTVTEINISSPALKAGAFHFGKYCDTQCKGRLVMRKESSPGVCLVEVMFDRPVFMDLDGEIQEYMLCRSEENDPRKCLSEGKDVTKCGIEFFNKVKQNCMAEFTNFWKCMDIYSQDLNISKCRKSQNIFDKCMSDRLGMDRPEVGFFSKIRIHETQRPKPKQKVVELPEAAPSPPNVDEHPDPPSMKIPGTKWI